MGLFINTQDTRQVRFGSLAHNLQSIGLSGLSMNTQDTLQVWIFVCLLFYGVHSLGFAHILQSMVRRAVRKGLVARLARGTVVG